MLIEPNFPSENKKYCISLISPSSFETEQTCQLVHQRWVLASAGSVDPLSDLDTHLSDLGAPMLIYAKLKF